MNWFLTALSIVVVVLSLLVMLLIAWQHAKPPLLWLLGRILAQPRIASWLINRARRTPYEHLPGYMERYWLFNGWGPNNKPRWPRLPSIRVNRILRADRGAHYHDHPADFRTFILRGWYCEARMLDRYSPHMRRTGDTVFLEHGQFHHISMVPAYGVWTLFVTWPRKGDWGFWVNGQKVLNRDYRGVR
jgi:hypothetical protein